MCQKQCRLDAILHVLQCLTSHQWCCNPFSRHISLSTRLSLACPLHSSLILVCIAAGSHFVFPSHWPCLLFIYLSVLFLIICFLTRRMCSWYTFLFCVWSSSSCWSMFSISDPPPPKWQGFLLRLLEPFCRQRSLRRLTRLYLCKGWIMCSKRKYKSETLPERFSGHLVKTRVVHLDWDAAEKTLMHFEACMTKTMFFNL